MMTRSRALGGVAMSDILQDANVDANLAQISGFDGMAYNGRVWFWSVVRFQYRHILNFQALHAKHISELRCYAKEAKPITKINTEI